MAIKARKLNMS